MTKKTTGTQKARKRYSEEFKQQALLRAAKDGVAAASRDLGLQPATVRVAREGTAAGPGRASPAQAKRGQSALSHSNKAL